MGAGRNWLIGCGLGCGVALLVFVLVVGGSFYALRDAVRGFRQLEDSQTALVEQHGAIADFRPRPDGTVPADRVLAFLAVRDTTAASRGRLDRALAEDVPTIRQEGRRSVQRLLRGVRAGFGFTGALAAYLRERSAALLARDMGLGEYLYLYSVVYYAWLDKDPGAGPREIQVDTAEGGGFAWDSDDTDGSQPEERRYRLRTRVHEHLLPMLAAQLAAADSAGGGAWRDTLAAEVARLRADPERLPWQDGLPEPLRASLEPWRAQLDAQWSEAANMLEILTLEDREGMSIRVERGDRGEEERPGG